MLFKDFLESDKKQYVSKYFHIDNGLYLDKVEGFTDLQELKPHMTGFLPDEYMKTSLIIKKANKKMNSTLKDIILKNGNSELLEKGEEEKEYIKRLKNEKEEQLDKIKNIRKNAMITGGFDRSEIDEMTNEFEDRIKDIDKEIKDILDESITDKDLDRFVETLQDIFEHINNMLNKGINSVSDEDMLHLIKLTTFELIKSPSEPLDIKLFEGLKKVFYDFGTPMENGTPVPALRRPCPNH